MLQKFIAICPASFHNCLMQNGSASGYISFVMGAMESFVVNEDGHGMEAAQLLLRPEKVWILIPATSPVRDIFAVCINRA
jgi:hypothetical protein